jgi:hypothetical protein
MFKQFSLKKNKTALVYGAIIICNILAGAWIRGDTIFFTPAFDPAQFVEALELENPDVFAAVRGELDYLVQTHGIQAAIDVNHHAFKNHKYGIYQCHVIMHLLGHEAVSYYGSDFDSVINAHVEYCELGYQHGAEAEVALSGGNYQEELYRMCTMIKQKNPNSACFHGAGHAFMNESLDVKKSLALCDDLQTDKFSQADFDTCYNSVFAELTNLVGGTDGGTGLPYTGGPPLSIGDQTPISYCSQFEGRYRTQCLFEFSGLRVNENSTTKDIQNKLLECTSSDFDEEMEAVCIHSVAAVGAQHELARSSTVVVPPEVLSYSAKARGAYIAGAGTEMLQYIISGVPKDWNKFCDNFKETDEYKSCTDIFNRL